MTPQLIQPVNKSIDVEFDQLASLQLGVYAIAGNMVGQVALA